MGLLYMLTLWSNVCVLIWALDLMVINAQRSHCLMVGHYKAYIISSVDHLRSNSVGLLELWIVMHNDQGTALYYRSFKITPTLPGKGNISGTSHC
jgi:hypothetical protein